MTLVPFGPLMSLTASSKRIPTTLTDSSSSSCRTFKMMSPTCNLFWRQAEPPEISSVMVISSIFFCKRAPMPSYFPDMEASKRSLSWGAK